MRLRESALGGLVAGTACPAWWVAFPARGHNGLDFPTIQQLLQGVVKPVAASVAPYTGSASLPMKAVLQS